MSFELKHALHDLDKRTPHFFAAEAIESGDDSARDMVIHVLRQPGSARAGMILREILRARYNIRES